MIVHRGADTSTVGLSRQHTLEETTRPRTQGSTRTKVNGLEPARTITNGDRSYINGSDRGKPFLEDELTHALTMTTLRPSPSESEP